MKRARDCSDSHSAEESPALKKRASERAGSPSPPESDQNQDWDLVFENMERLRRQRSVEMDQEARRRALLRTVSEPTNVRQLVDFCQTISKEDRCPPSEVEIGPEDLKSLKTEFGADILVQLDSLVSELAPKPSSLTALWKALDQFDTNAEVMERKFAGSAFATTLLPPTLTTVSGKQTNIEVVLDHQSTLYRGTKENRTAYMFPGVSSESYLTAVRRADFSYCLSKKIYVRPGNRDSLFPQDDNHNHFPCHSATFDSLFPLATGEVKVAGHPYKQRFQQAFYASYYIMSWLILRILQKSAEPDHTWGSAEELLDGVRHCCFSVSPQTLQIWEYRPCFDPESGDLSVSAKILCSGAPGDQTFMEEVYIPWCRYVLKRGIVEQRQKLLPAIKSYAARPFPRPFDHSDTVFLKVRDFNLRTLNMSNSSFSNQPSDEQTQLHEIVKPYEEALKLASQSGRKRKSSQSAETTDGFTETESSPY